MHDPNDPRDVRRARREAELRQRLLDKQLSELLSTSSGRALIYDILCYCGSFQSPFSTDIAVMAHAVGRGDVGRKLLADINRVSPQAYLLMLEEGENGLTGKRDSGDAADASVRDPGGYATDDGSAED